MGGCSSREVPQQCWDRPRGLSAQGQRQAVSPGRRDQLRMGAVLSQREFPLEPTAHCDSSDLDSFFFFFFCLSRATPTAHGGSQARGPIGAVAAGHSHSNAGSKPRL